MLLDAVTSRSMAGGGRGKDTKGSPLLPPRDVVRVCDIEEEEEEELTPKKACSFIDVVLCNSRGCCSKEGLKDRSIGDSWSDIEEANSSDELRISSSSRPSSWLSYPMTSSSKL